MKRLHWVLAAALAVMVITGCGGGGGGSGDGDSLSSEEVGSADATYLTGRFVGVSGLEYETTSGVRGTTDENGEFSYSEGDDVLFVADKIKLGAVQADENITIFSFQRPELVSQVLQALDIDANLSNGIQIDSGDTGQRGLASRSIRPRVEGGLAYEIDLQSVDPFSSRYRSYFEERGFTPQSAKQALINQVVAALPNREKGSRGYWRRIMAGEGIAPSSMLNRFAADPSVQRLYNARYPYWYRVKAATLYGLYLQFTRMEQKTRNRVIDDNEVYSKWVDDVTAEIDYSMDLGLDVDTYIEGDIFEIMSSISESTYNFSSTKVPPEFGPTASLVGTAIFHCSKTITNKKIDKDDLRECIQGTMKAMLDEVILEEFGDKDPIWTVALHGATNTINNLVNVAMECKKGPNYKCFKTAFKAVAHDLMVASGNLAKTFKLDVDQGEANSFALATEIFLARRYLSPGSGEGGICNAVSFYAGGDNGVKRECEKKNNPDAKLQFLINKIIESNVISSWYDPNGPDYNYQTVKNNLEKMKAMYAENLKIMTEKTSQYQGKALEKQALSDAQKDFILKAPRIVDVVQTSEHTFKIKACFDLINNRVMDEISYGFAIADHNGEQSLSLLDGKGAYGSGSRTICGEIEEYNPFDIENNPNGDIALQVTVKFKPGQSQRSYTLVNGSTYSLGSTERIVYEVSKIGLFVEMDADDLRSGRGSVTILSGGEDIASYHWLLSDEAGNIACRLESDGTNQQFSFTIPQECHESMLALTVKAYDVNGALLDSDTVDIDPVSTPSVKEFDKLQVELRPKVYGVTSSSEAKGDILPKGGSRPYYYRLLSNPKDFNITLSENGAVKVTSGSNDPAKSYREEVQIEVSDDSGQSEVVTIELYRFADLARGINTASGDNNPKSVWPSKPAKVSNGAIEQTWGLVNQSDTVIAGVVLKKDPNYCDDVFHPRSDEIVVGDMAPGEIKVKAIYDFGATDGDWFCQWNLYAMINGEETRLNWPGSARPANLYSYFEISDAIPPKVAGLKISQNGKLIEGSFRITQPNDSIKGLKIEFSPRVYFPVESTQMVEIGDPQNVQNSGEKSFSFDIGVWPRNIVYWRLSATNGSGVAMKPLAGSFALKDYTPPTIFSAEPAFMVKDERSSILVTGTNLPSDLAMSLQDAECYPAVVNAEGTRASMLCTPRASGKKRLYIAVKSGGEGVVGQDDLYINVVESGAEIIVFDGGMSIDMLEEGLSISWDAAKGPGVRYELYRSKSPNSIGTKIYIGGGRSFTDKQVFDGETYYYTVKACSSNGCVIGPKQKVTYEKAQIHESIPRLSLVDKPKTKLLQSEALDLSIEIEDSDDSSVKLAVIWGDGSHAVATHEIGQMVWSHEYTANGIYYWRVQAADAKGQKSNILQGSVVVVDAELPSGGEDLKALLGGATWYGVETKPEGYRTLTEFRFDSQMSRLDWRDIEGGDGSGSQTLEVTGNVVKVIDDTEESYFRVVDVKNGYIVIESIDVASGIIYAVNGRMKLYRDLADAKAEYDENTSPGTMADLPALIVGKTFYQYCLDGGSGQMLRYTFGGDGVLTFVDYDGEVKKIPYRIEGDSVYTKEGTTEERHLLKGYTDNSVTFLDSDGGTTTFYTTESAALAAPSDGCGGGDGNHTLVADIITGHVTFYDQSGNKAAVPSDAWIRVTPKAFQVDGQWHGINCRIESSGSFGTECYIDIDEEQMRTELGGDTTYQVVVYKNSVEPERHHWDREEPVYKFVGEELPFGSWSSVTVRPEDYHDNSPVQGVGITLSGSYTPAALTSPNGGENWLYGESHVVKWNSVALRGNRVDLFVLHDDPAEILNAQNVNDTAALRMAVESAGWYRFAQNIANTGSYGVMTEELNGSGNAYLVLVVTDEGDWDISDGTFSLTSEAGSGLPAIVLFAPSPENHKAGVSKTPIFGWASDYQGNENLEFFVEVGESPDNLVYNSGWITTGQRAAWELFSSDTLRPNTQYFWRVLAREKGKTKESYGGKYPSSEIWDFTTTSVSPDLAITGVERLDDIKPGESVRFKVTVKNVGSREAQPENINLYYEKSGATYRFATHGVYTMTSGLAPGESETLVVQADFRDTVVERDGIVYDNVLVDGESFIIFDMPTIGNDDFDQTNNVFRYKIVYQNSGLPVFEYFTIGPVSVYEGNASFPLYTSIGRSVDRGMGNGISFSATDDFKITKATIDYRINELDAWHAITEIANDQRSISVNYDWIVPEDRSLITDTMQIRVRVYENNTSFSEKVSYPFPVYDNRLNISLQAVGERTAGDSFDLSINVDSAYMLRRLTVTLKGGSKKEILYEKVDVDGFAPLSSIALTLPRDNSFASDNAELIVEVTDIHSNSSQVSTLFRLNPNTDLGDRFTTLVDLYNKEYGAYPAGSTDRRTENSVYKVSMRNGIVHALVSSVAWWKEAGASEFSRDFQYFYITYNTATAEISNPLKIISIVQRNSGSLPDEQVVDFMMSQDGTPIVLTYDQSDSHMSTYIHDGSKVSAQSFDAGGSKDSFELMNYDGRTFVVYRSIDSNGSKLLKAKAVYPLLGATNSVSDTYYGSRMRLHGDLVYFVWSGKAFNIDRDLKIVGTPIFDIGNQNKAIYGSIESADGNMIDIALNDNNDLVGVYIDGKTEVLTSLDDSYSLQRTGYLARLNGVIGLTRILLVYEVASDGFEDYKIVEIDRSSGIISETKLSSSYDSTKLSNLVSIEGGLIAVGNPTRGSAYLAIGDFR